MNDTTRGYICFTDTNYSALSSILMDSLRLFSQYPFMCFVNSVDAQRALSNYPTILIESTGGLGLIAMMAQSPFDQTCLIDADTVVTPSVDRLWELFTNSTTPDFCIHPHHDKNDMMIKGAQARYPALGRNAIKPYVHGAPNLFGKRASEWVKQLVARAVETVEGKQHLCHESLFNIMRWEAGCGRYSPYVIIDRGYVDTWQIPFYGVHGEKDPEAAQALLTKLKQLT